MISVILQKILNEMPFDEKIVITYSNRENCYDFIRSEFSLRPLSKFLAYHGAIATRRAIDTT